MPQKNNQQSNPLVDSHKEIVEQNPPLRPINWKELTNLLLGSSPTDTLHPSDSDDEEASDEESVEMAPIDWEYVADLIDESNKEYESRLNSAKANEGYYKSGNHSLLHSTPKEQTATSPSCGFRLPRLFR